MTLPDPLAQQPLLRLWGVLPEARVVGGAVRDVLAGRPIADIDLATPLPPEQVSEALAAAGIRVIPTGLAHGTVTALVDHQPFEVTTLRRDVATDGRHAVVAFTDDWQADAARRDFTFNAMSMDRHGALWDYFGGADDLAAGRVRFVGEPARRLAEDYLRVLRYFRFFARYARQHPDPATSGALRDAAPHVVRLSAERVWAEMQRILATPEPASAIGLMHELGVLEWVVPDLDPGWRRTFARRLPPEPLLRLAALSSADPALLAERYRLSSAEAARLCEMRGEAPPEGSDDASLRRDLDEVGRQGLTDRMWLQGRSDELRSRLGALPDPVFPVRGRDLIAAGMSAGPELGRRLEALRTLWRDGGCVAGRDELLGQLVPPAAG